MELTTIVVLGGLLAGIWDNTGGKLDYTPAVEPQKYHAVVKPQYFRVRLPQCAKDQREQHISVRMGRTTKRYTVECSPEVYLEWHRTPAHPEYQKTLVRRTQVSP